MRRHVYAVIDRDGEDWPVLYETKADAERRVQRQPYGAWGERYSVQRLPVYTSATRKAKRTTRRSGAKIGGAQT